MMYEPEKSDSAIVAVKPANKARQTLAAEWVEPRAGILTVLVFHVPK